jgi:putative oxidoreductase
VDGVDLAAVLLRGIVGFTMLAHGWNHVFGGGKLPGVERWFASLGFRHARLQALLASYGELLYGVLLVVGLLTPFAAAGVFGTMAVAFWANHRPNGYFIFRKGEGYEYVLALAVVAAAIGAVGAGRWSLDRVVGIDLDLDGLLGLAIVVVGGSLGAVIVLLTSWRPARRS